MMKKNIIILLVSLLAVTSCAEKWEWTVPLAVNSTEVKIPLVTASHIYVPIFSTVTWNIHFEYPDGTATEWLHPDMTSGKGYNVCVRVDYDENTTGAERSADMVIVPQDTSSGAETIKVHLIQGGA